MKGAAPKLSGSREEELELQLNLERRRIAAIRELGRVLGSTLDFEPLLEALLKTTTQILDAERATIFLLTERRTELGSMITEGGAVAPIWLKLGEGVAGWVAETGEIANIPDAYSDARFNQAVDQKTGFRTRSILCMPLHDHRGRSIGVIQVLNKLHGFPFDGDDEALLSTASAHIGISIENAQLYRSVLRRNEALITAQDELKRHVEELDLLFEISRELLSSIALDELLDRLVLKLIHLMDCEAGSILLGGGATAELFYRNTRGDAGSQMGRLRVENDRGIASWVARERQPLLSNAPASDPRYDGALATQIKVEVRSLLCAPLQHGPADGDTVGAITLLNKRDRAGFNEKDLKLLSVVAGQISTSIAVARTRDERLRSERLQMIGQMMSGVLHDVKTPATVMSGYAQLMAESDDPAERARYAALISKQCQLMSAMTGEVLMFARGESNLLPHKVMLDKFAEELREQLLPLFEKQKIALEVRVDQVGAAHFDELKLLRLAHNLARNAAEAMAYTPSPRFRITLGAESDQLHLSFADSGPGIPEEMRGRLFQAFATSGKVGGTGIGLAICKRIVDEHRGRIECDSSPGKGTTFHVWLPLKRSAA